MILLCAAFVLLLSATAVAAYLGLVGFGVCTLWFDRIGPWNWHTCCSQHDRDYGAQIAKAVADAHLEQCVNAILPGMGTVMFVGVSLFGGLWYVMARRRKA